jgi:hypothetical protein
MSTKSHRRTWQLLVTADGTSPIVRVEQTIPGSAGLPHTFDRRAFREFVSTVDNAARRLHDTAPEVLGCAPVHGIKVVESFDAGEIIIRTGCYYDLDHPGFCICLGLFDRDADQPFLTVRNDAIRQIVADLQAAEISISAASDK